MNILITAIGSMSAECAIKHLRACGHFVVGCDIYPGEWHYETSLCDAFYQAPLATRREEYVDFLLSVCSRHGITALLPLTDLEIDVINGFRERFEARGITLCMQSAEVLEIARNKYRLYQTFREDGEVPSVVTQLLSETAPDRLSYPLIAKPYDGRSSEGLLVAKRPEQLAGLAGKEKYIVQELKEGPVFTVDYIRQAATGTEMAVPRQELLRTKNGAGLTVKVTNSPQLSALVSRIGRTLNVNGCVNMEFIENGGAYYLIDINPRFSAGVAFSVLAGYDMVTNHLRCFTGEAIDAPVEFEDRIVIKKYSEVVL